MIDEIYINEEFHDGEDVESTLTLIISFEDFPERLHMGRMPPGCTRKGVATMLRELALHIEHNTGAKVH